MDRQQMSFLPSDYCFQWTPDNWYKWDSKEAHRHAKEEQDRTAKELKAQGYQIKKYTHSNQLLKHGGIGSGRPGIDLVCTVYGLNYWK